MSAERKAIPLSPDHAALAVAVREAIAANEGMTQKTLASDSGLTPKQISEIVLGQANPTYLNLLKLSAGLKTSLGALMVRADELREDPPGKDG
jgi:transcriptional regulator with XRE-family HTH domain